ncbi:carbon starvation CstA family protein [Deinococcus sp. Marseille-Q6407]|uniref:carbon starvation CstA family protein n=1 Tax=Deinococcus sp. Marseille-Q6407 TaxID=2969223 RepID=UPI0021BF7D5F|nr:carbon starvation CstA family protein [Deinococcus sp. Marseille-Q6407]
MITFLVSLVILVVGYFTYGAWIERMFQANDGRPTPALTHADGVDYVPMGEGRNSLIQPLNIAGVGPIFGPIMGALYGPVAFLWIVFGSIFAGAVHDYLTGMISIRNGGAHLPALAEKYLGKAFRHVVNAFGAAAAGAGRHGVRDGAGWPDRGHLAGLGHAGAGHGGDFTSWPPCCRWTRSSGGCIQRSGYCC